MSSISTILLHLMDILLVIALHLAALISITVLYRLRFDIRSLALHIRQNAVTSYIADLVVKLYSNNHSSTLR